jgi:hypothetical protein
MTLKIYFQLEIICIHAGITEVLDPKGLRKGMNRQDTNERTRRLMTNWQIFYFCIRLISSTKQEVIQCKENFYAWETMPST